MNRSARFLPPVVLSLLVAAAMAIDIWLLTDRAAGLQLMILVLGLELLVLAGAIWMFAVVMEIRLYRPLRRFEDQLDVLLHSDSDHRFELGDSHGLGRLPGLVEALGRELARERRETARMMNAVAERIDHRKSRLEAILRDLHEGVVVCNDDHRIVLFNQSAVSFLRGTGPVGLHRSITTLLEGGNTREQYRRLKERFENAPGSPLLASFTDTTVDGRSVDLRMSLVTGHEDRCSGYVLSFSGDGIEARRARTGEGNGILSDRPEFYDFSLFDARRPAHAGGYLDELDYVVFDTETTGLSPSRGDRIVQISGVRLVRGRPTGEEFDTLVNPGIPIPPASIRFHGITDDLVADAPSASEAVAAFKAFVEGSVLVAHNAAFDMKFLEMLEPESGVSFDNTVLDTLLLSFVLQPNHNAHSLDAIAARFGVSIAEEVRHTALGDARATAEVFVKMLPVLRRNGLETLARALNASDRVFHIRRQQENL